MQSTTASVLIIGNEILSGRTQDTNLRAIAKKLAQRGITVEETWVIPDNPDKIIHSINHLRTTYDFVFTTGGIGVTHDDKTIACVARAFNQPLVISPVITDILHEIYGPNQLDDIKRRFTLIPQGARLIANSVSKIPGIIMDNVFVLAGMPLVMEAMMEAVTGDLPFHGAILSRSYTADIMENDIAAAIEALQEDYPQISIGSYPYYKDSKPGVSIILRGNDREILDSVGAKVVNIFREVGIDYSMIKEE